MITFQELISQDDVSSDISSETKMKGLTICNGKVKGRAFVALNLQEAQNITVK